MLVGDVSSVVRIVDSPTKTAPGVATDWNREAVFTRSPATIPWSSASRVTAASPVRTRACAKVRRALFLVRDPSRWR